MNSSLYSVSFDIFNTYLFIFFEAKLRPEESAQWIEVGQCLGCQVIIN